MIAKTLKVLCFNFMGRRSDCVETLNTTSNLFLFTNKTNNNSLRILPKGSFPFLSVFCVCHAESPHSIHRLIRSKTHTRGSTMGKARKAFEEFVAGIPDDKLSGLSNQSQTIYKDEIFRLDMQGMTSFPHSFNLQVQINRQTKVTSLKKAAPSTVSIVLVPDPQTMMVQNLKSVLVSNSLI